MNFRKLLTSFLLFSFIFFVSYSQQNSKLLQTINPEKIKFTERSDVNTKWADNKNTLVISSNPLSSPYTMDMGWIDVQPNISYKVVYSFTPESLTEAGNVYILVREHASVGTRPLSQDYHREPAYSRIVATNQNGKQIVREIEFSTSADTKNLSISIVIASLTGELRFSDLQIFGGQGASATLSKTEPSTPAKTVAAPVLPTVIKPVGDPVYKIESKNFNFSGRDDYRVKNFRKDGMITITSTSLDKDLSMDLGWLTVEPNTAYRAIYSFLPESLVDAAMVYILIREHESKGTRPVSQNYHRESVALREVPISYVGKTIDREVFFSTTSSTKLLSASIIIAKLNGELKFSDFKLYSEKVATQVPVAGSSIIAKGADVTFEALKKELQEQAKQRKQILERPLVYSRSQFKYGLAQNYYHNWSDRPLSMNRSYWEPSPYINPPKSYKHSMEEIIRYDIDGFAGFPETTGRLEMYNLHEQLSAEVPGVQYTMEFYDYQPDPAVYPNMTKQRAQIINRVYQSPASPKINGKLLITSYNAQNIRPALWKAHLDSLRLLVGDKFIFVAALTTGANLKTNLLNGTPITSADIEKEKNTLRTYLDVTDGIYFFYPPSLTNKDRTFDREFYEEFLIPLYKSVLSEPAYKNKFFGLSSYRSHMSPDRGNHLHEDYTGTLRNSFEPAMLAHPDFIILPEWDEQNENSHFRPTIYSSNSTGRILRYYMSQLKEKMATPIPRDDTDLPNLILTTRKNITMGEKVTVELLNVPDTHVGGKYQVKLILQDENGKLVRQFDNIEFAENELKEKRFSFPSEEIPNVRALIPVLQIYNYKGRNYTFDSGFHFIQIRSSWNWDYQTVKQPLRDMLRPDVAKLEWIKSSTNDNSIIISGNVSSPEDLDFVEILGDDDEVYSVDPMNEFYRDDMTKQLYLIGLRSINSNNIQGTISVKNGTALWLSEGMSLKKTANSAEFNTALSSAIKWIYLILPKNDVNAAVLDFALDKAKFSVSLKDVLDKKMIGQGFANGIHITVKPYDRQISMPYPVNKSNVSFSIKATPEINTELFQLRLISSEGKTYWSRPLVLSSNNLSNKKSLRIYSDTQNKGIDVLVDEDRIPNIKYDFRSDRGAVLLTNAGTPFWASLGGFTHNTTGRGSVNGVFDGSTRGKYPANTPRSNPTWVIEDGKPCLEFDGIGNFLKLPRETLPARGAYTITMDVKPTSTINQFLLVNRVVGSQKGLSLQIENGKLVAIYFDNNWQSNTFKTSLSVPANQWSEIVVKHDFDKLKLSVNGQTESFDLKLPAYNIGFTIIGEGWTGNWFKGRIRKLEILHNVE